MKKEGKKEIVKEVRGILNDSAVALVVHYRGLTVGEMSELREAFFKAGSTLRVAKNTLTKLAAKGTDYEPIAELMTGPTAIACGPDPVAPAKVLVKFAKDHPNLKILGGVLDGQLIDSDKVVALSKLPSREELIAKMLGSMNAPITNFVGVLAAVPGSFVRVLEQIRQQKEEQAA